MHMDPPPCPHMATYDLDVLERVHKKRPTFDLAAVVTLIFAWSSFWSTRTHSYTVAVWYWPMPTTLLWPTCNMPCSGWYTAFFTQARTTSPKMVKLSTVRRRCFFATRTCTPTHNSISRRAAAHVKVRHVLV